MRQVAPYPTVLAELVAQLRYRPGWTFRLGDFKRDTVDPADIASDELAGGLTLDIITWGYDSYHRPNQPEWPGSHFWTSAVCSDCGEPWPCRRDPYRVHHYRIVPAATFNRESWRRWLLDQCLEVERHEAMEFFDVAGDRPYKPNHGPGHDPYVVREVTTDEARRTSYKGVVSG